ncbi:MAG: hypothetical protein QM760_12595 [Nibricoccus sp.]
MRLKEMSVWLFIATMTVSCVSRPPKRALMAPIPQCITVKSDTPVTSNHIDKWSAVLRADDYHLVAEDFAFFYYANSDGVIILKGEPRCGGIAYEKSLGGFCVYETVPKPGLSIMIEVEKPPFSAVFIKSLSEDSIHRMFRLWVLENPPQNWEFSQKTPGPVPSKSIAESTGAGAHEHPR